MIDARLRRGVGTREHEVATAEPEAARQRRLRREVAGYGAVAFGLAALLLWQVHEVNAFYNDEWLYVSMAQAIWAHFPSGLVEPIAFWDRGVQRAYSALLAPLFGVFGRSDGYNVAHVVNVLLVSSASVPLALIARRLIERPALRVLAVALALVLPWTMITVHLLTESLAFPVFVWTCLAIVRAAEKPTLARQAVALAAIVGLVLCRVEFAVMIGVLVICSLGGEVLRPRVERPARAMFRRQAPILLLLAIGIGAGWYLLGPGLSHLGHYGSLDLHQFRSRLIGNDSTFTRTTALTYVRSLVLGTFVLPFALGLATAFAGVAGRLGRRTGIVSLLALSSTVLVVGSVSISTTHGALEERYVFYVVPPLAVLAVAGIEQARRVWPWAILASAFSWWAVAKGVAFPALDSGNFFAAPSGAFWSRVMDYRLHTVGRDLLGWLGANPGLAFWAGLGLAVLPLALFLTTRLRHVSAILIAAAVLCLAGQAVMLSYSLKQELHGTVDRPGGIAGAVRETFVDGAVPSGARATVVPEVVTPTAPDGGAERLTFWNADIDSIVSVAWNGTPVWAPAGSSVITSALGNDGLARLDSPLRRFVAAQVDDPRVQFADRLVRRSRVSNFGLFREPRSRALWTAAGLGTDGTVAVGTPVRLALDRAAGVRTARVTLQAGPLPQPPVRWAVRDDRGVVAAGQLAPGATRTVRLAAPSCEARCGAWTWQLASRPGRKGSATAPDAQGVLAITAVHLGRRT